MILISEKPLDIEAATTAVATDNSGAINVFVGTVRNATSNKKVVALEFESYEPMALKEMNKIAAIVASKWEINSIAIHHRVGRLDIGDIPVVIAVSTPHRKDGFEACQYAIDTLKDTVPIWKKEIFEDGEVWVASHP